MLSVLSFASEEDCELVYFPDDVKVERVRIDFRDYIITLSGVYAPCQVNGQEGIREVKVIPDHAEVYLRHPIEIPGVGKVYALQSFRNDAWVRGVLYYKNGRWWYVQFVDFAKMATHFTDHEMEILSSDREVEVSSDGAIVRMTFSRWYQIEFPAF